MFSRSIARITMTASLLMLSSTAFAQLPNPTHGWNLGNTLEPPSGEGSWGPPASQALINSVANAGFNTVRIPCAWDSHANQSTYQIDPAYMARVKQVVDWCFARNLHVVINCHWDGGWLDANLTGTVKPTINAKMNSYWSQIATTFAGYNNRLLFAAANEPPADNAAKLSELMTYYQTFINVVRSKGGNNSSRWLVVQGPNTDITLTDSLMNTLPNDPTPGRLMVEVHYYTPYQFTLMPTDQSWGNMFYFWGQGYHSATNPSRNATWGEEAYTDAEFRKMYNKFTSKGIPVILGEFGAFPRSNLTGADVNLNNASTTYWNKYVVDSARSHGIYPIYWETPGGAFDWTTGAIRNQNVVNSLTGRGALPPPGGDGAQHCFELSTQGWASSGAPITGVTTATTQRFAGSRSLAVSFNGAAGTSAVTIAAPSTPAGKTITFRVWIPSGSKISAIQPFAQDRNWAWTGNYKPIGNLTANAWNNITVVVPPNAVTPLQQLGVQFSTSATWTGTCYIDSVSW
ncbi:MAG: glycoside hydrolase family 5 protein [Fibrella sp.]|nr:glycoside hydrolase family 5 protein [Armatimonadota bacterium]